ncbi:hypothetical protein CPB85DRAFT_1258530 [Mucidula mucida]|nr:hypothetical protein CPB85DRAFT_1258527 [Mucidula mucida]KAF8886117.1 hypothetical protein CPB85DRAFT_1258530 [Mucidula mucida]
MARQVQATVDEDPSLWRIIITPTLFISAFFSLENGISLDAYVLMGLAAAQPAYHAESKSSLKKLRIHCARRTGRSPKASKTGEPNVQVTYDAVVIFDGALSLPWRRMRVPRFSVKCLTALPVYKPCPPCSSIAVKMRSVLGILAYFPVIFALETPSDVQQAFDNANLGAFILVSEISEMPSSDTNALEFDPT